MQHRFTNRLIHESSPYLLQHAHNPVDWYAWGDEALQHAKQQDKPILVSIGYSACHWCHVMEHESFENETVAAFMNQNFINIKIDREERPDLDHIYMDAVQAMTGSGGWPLNVFLTPEAKPFYGGTYFPPSPAFNRSSWIQVLQGVSQAWQDKRKDIIDQAEHLTGHLLKSGDIVAHATGINAGQEGKEDIFQQCVSMFETIMRQADQEWGGFGKAPKFPQTFLIQYLFQYHYFTGDKQALDQALLSIDKMLMGGIYDQVGGGLARYSTDNEWLAPHFEKMLYDNALLINILCDAYQLTAKADYESAIRKTIGFLTRELQSPEGGFYAALDADSEGEEGRYYVWQKAEVDQLLGEGSSLFCSFFDITENGNWEGKNILRMLKKPADFIVENGLSEARFHQVIAAGLQKLSAHRNSRTRPGLDDKIILSWNSLLVKALAKAAIVLQDDGYRALAERSCEFILDKFAIGNDSNELQHTYKNGEAKYQAFLDDYAYLVAALLELYRATLKVDYLNQAYRFSTHVVADFTDSEQIYFFFTGAGQKNIIFRKKEIYDGATASGNAVMADNLMQLGVLFDQSTWRERAFQMLSGMAPMVSKYPSSFGVWASLLLKQATDINEVTIVGKGFKTAAQQVLLKFIPNLLLMASDSGDERFTMLTGKAATGEVSLFLCRNYACLPSFSDVESMLMEIDETNKITI